MFSQQVVVAKQPMLCQPTLGSPACNHQFTLLPIEPSFNAIQRPSKTFAVLGRKDLATGVSELCF